MTKAKKNNVLTKAKLPIENQSNRKWDGGGKNQKEGLEGCGKTKKRGWRCGGTHGVSRWTGSAGRIPAQRSLALGLKYRILLYNILKDGKRE